ncbi:MAG: hypothetical protein QXN05_02555 [Acidilobaceae archaeon]
MPKRLTSMKLALEALGLKQLDVYRIAEDNRLVDIVRVKDLTSEKVVTINLGTVRESLEVSEFVDRVVSELVRVGVKVDERKLSALKSKLSIGKRLS